MYIKCLNEEHAEHCYWQESGLDTGMENLVSIPFSIIPVLGNYFYIVKWNHVIQINVNIYF